MAKQQPELTPEERREREKRYWAKWRMDQAQKAIRQGHPGLTQNEAEHFRALLHQKSLRLLDPLRMYEPQPKQLLFHKSKAAERLALGANRGMKTTCCAFELAWAVMGCHPYLKYPKENGRAICVAEDVKRIGQVMYWKLFRAGAFKMIRDKQTGIYRAWDPDTDGDDETDLKPCLPLLPARAIKSISWDKKSLYAPSLVTFKNGWEIAFYASGGKPPRGVDVDACWFDEEVASEEWYSEMAARLIDRQGRFFWSATPQTGTDVLWSLHERAVDEATKPEPSIEAFRFLLSDNKFLTKKAKDEFIHKMGSDPDQYRVRVLGEFAIQSHRVYPNFARTKHSLDAFDIPHDWCRYLVIDPGFANICALFFAVPPPDHPMAGHVYVYDELQVQQMDAKTFALRLYHKMGEQRFQAFLIDAHGARRTEVIGKSIGLQYAEEFEKLHMRSIETGSNFIMVGTTDKFGKETLKAEVSQTRTWLWEREELGGLPILQIFHDRCPQLMDQMGKYKNKVENGKPTDTPDARKYSHGPDCVRYACLHGMKYVEPKRVPRKKKGIGEFVKEKKRKKRDAEGNFILMGSA